MRSLAATIAAIAFFALAGLGLASGLPPFACAVRSLAGAAIVYVMAAFVGKVALSIFADAAVRQQSAPKSTREQ